MTRRLECVVDGCNATIEAENNDAVMEQFESHVQSDHPDMELDDETRESLRRQITDA